MTNIPILDTVHFNSTTNCNLACAHCHDNAPRGETTNLSIETIVEFAKDARELGARRVILSVGEPMVCADWRQVARIFDAEGMEVSLATEGALVDEDVAAFLATLGKVTVSVSIDGDEANHDRLQGRTSAHRRTLAGLRALLAAGLNVDVNATMFSSNLDVLPFFTRIARDLGCDVRLSLHDSEQLDADDFHELESIVRLREYCDALRAMGVPLFVDEASPERGAACTVLANGDVAIRGVGSDEPTLVGNLATQRLEDMWRGDQGSRHT